MTASLFPLVSYRFTSQLQTGLSLGYTGSFLRSDSVLMQDMGMQFKGDNEEV